MASGYLDYTPGMVPTATQFKEFIGLQVTGVYASAAARDAALAAVLREGIFAYLLDVPNRLTYYDGSAWQTVTSEYTSWTPTYTNITIGNGSAFAIYAVAGIKTVHATWNFTLGSSSAIGTSPQITLPVAPGTVADVDSVVVTYKDVSAGTTTIGKVSFISGSNCELTALNAGGTFVSLSGVSSTSPFTWATSDTISFGFTYRV